MERGDAGSLLLGGADFERAIAPHQSTEGEPLDPASPTHIARNGLPRDDAQNKLTAFVIRCSPNPPQSCSDADQEFVFQMQQAINTAESAYAVANCLVGQAGALRDAQSAVNILQSLMRSKY